MPAAAGRRRATTTSTLMEKACSIRAKIDTFVGRKSVHHGGGQSRITATGVGEAVAHDVAGYVASQDAQHREDMGEKKGYEERILFMENTIKTAESELETLKYNPQRSDEQEKRYIKLLQIVKNVKNRLQESKDKLKTIPLSTAYPIPIPNYNEYV
jgi:hypothetical protein